jgi:hypothetical protein
MALGAALAVALALPGCGGGNSETKAPDPAPDENISPPYGIPPPDPEEAPPPDQTTSDAGITDTPQPPDGVPAAMYGVPPP